MKWVIVRGSFIPLNSITSICFDSISKEKERLITIYVCTFNDKLKDTYYSKTNLISESEIETIFTQFIKNDEKIFDFDKICEEIEESHKVDENICNC